jgi:CTD small phosphatase-like protein 2
LIDLDETLIHAEDARPNKKYDTVVEMSQPGARRVDKIGVNIRPYCTEFLRRMSKKFELIIFTAGRQDYADKMVDMLDPNREFISHRLYRHHCSRFEGINVKEFRLIANRKPEEIMIIDNYIYSFSSNLANGIPVKPYISGKEDCELEYIADKLENMTDYDVCSDYLAKAFKLPQFYQYLSNGRF